MIFRKLSDLKREQELADKSKMEIIDSIESTGSNNAIKKLINKLRKKSIDSRAENEPFHSDSITNMNTSNQQSISALSLVSAPAINIATYGFNSKLDNASTKSTSGSNLALPSSVSGQRLITISERSENLVRKNSQPHSPTKNDGKNLPILPPLNQATSVKQKWNILLSKAKGGVENIPKAFLSSTPEENEPTENAENNVCRKDKDQLQKNQIPSIYTTSDDAELLSFRSRTNQSNNNNIMSSDLEESGGFFLNLVSLDDELFSAKSGPPDDGLNSNPYQMLKVLFNRRNELKNQAEMLNGRINKVDSRISDILHLITTHGSPSNATDINQIKSNYNLEKGTSNFLEVRPQSKTISIDSSLSFSFKNNLSENNEPPELKTGGIFTGSKDEKSQLPEAFLEKKDQENRNKLAFKTEPPSKHSKTNLKSKKSDLAGSNASVINQAVESATAIFNSKNPFSSSFIGVSSHSNYNVNLIPMETDSCKKPITGSNSDYSLKDRQFRKFFEKKNNKFVYDQEIEEERLLDKK